MKKELTTQEIYLLAQAQRIHVDLILKVKNLLDVRKVRGRLILCEYRQYVKEKQFAKKKIIEMLMKKHSVSKSYIEQIIYDQQTNRGKQCVRCGKRISTYIYGRNNGVCETCLNKELKNIDIYEQLGDDMCDEESQGREDLDNIPQQE